MHNHSRLFCVFVSVLVVVYFIGGPVVSASERARGNDQPIAGVSVGADGIYFVPKVENGYLVITVSAPNGSVFKKSFDSGDTPYLGLSEICEDQTLEGPYTYELRVSPPGKSRVRTGAEGFEVKAGKKARKAITQTGCFTVRRGSIVIPSTMPEPNGQGIARPEQTYNEDLYVTGSICVGADCIDPETWLDDVIRLKESNLRLHFDDTSSTSAFPANDWRILINDTADAGANYFAVEDTTAGDVPFKIEAGAPENSLYIEDYGRIGIKTAAPAVDLHIVDGDSPCTRLEQDTTMGFSAQVWDIAGNESNFFIRDITNSSNVPFKIQPGTPSSTLSLKADGKVGFGTESPGYKLEAETTGENCAIVADRTDGATNYMNATASYANFGSITNHPVRIVVNSGTKMFLEQDGDVAIGGGGSPSPPYKLTVYNDAGTAYGYSDGGSWGTGSSRKFKEDIKTLDGKEAMEAFQRLKPIRYKYKGVQKEEHLGFIAEDVPELVATGNRDSIHAMDIVTLLTKVVQEQQESMEKQQKTISELQERIAALEKR